MKIIIVNCGYGAVMNGAENPIKKLHDIAACADTYVMTGQHWGDDRIEVSDEHFPMVLEMLEESCLLYRIQGQMFTDWHGIKTGSEYEQHYGKKEIQS